MQALSADTYSSDITNMLNKLCSVDPYRTAYYKDLCKSGWVSLEICHLFKEFPAVIKAIPVAGSEVRGQVYNQPTMFQQCFLVRHVSVFTIS